MQTTHKISSSEIVKYVIADTVSILDYSYATSKAASETLKLLQTKDAFRYGGFEVYGYVGRTCKLVSLSDIDDSEYPEEVQVDGKPNEHQLEDIFRSNGAFKQPVETPLQHLRAKLNKSITDYGNCIKYCDDNKSRDDAVIKLAVANDVLLIVETMIPDDKETIRKDILTRTNARHRCPRCGSIVYPFLGNYCPQCGQLFSIDEECKPPTK